ncbi:hypothetical protein [Persephonella sp.]
MRESYLKAKISVVGEESTMTHKVEILELRKNGSYKLGQALEASISQIGSNLFTQFREPSVYELEISVRKIEGGE